MLRSKLCAAVVVEPVCDCPSSGSLPADPIKSSSLHSPFSVRDHSCGWTGCEDKLPVVYVAG